MTFLPYGRHTIDEDDIDAVVDVLRNGLLTSGPKAAEFERLFAKKVGAAEACVCSNGTTALHLACLVAGLGPGDLAIVPTVTFLSTANAVRMTGADVIFADVDADTGLLTPQTLLHAYQKANKPVKAVLPVHLNGQCCDAEAVYEIARANGSQIISDCCHALGAEYKTGGWPGDGQYEDFACFSLHPVKSIAMGEGGVVTTNSSQFAIQLRNLRGHDMRRAAEDWQHSNLAFDSDGAENPWYYEMQELGFNYRATDLQCALGISQLGKLGAFVKRRREIADRYDALVQKLGNRLVPVKRTETANSAWHLYPVLIDFEALGKTRASVMAELRDRGVGTQVHYIPVSSQPYYVELYGGQTFAGAERYYSCALSLPIFPTMTDNDVDFVVKSLEEVLS
jgi:UDP-4-amino-4,6-dideoxy-N-acetyl-beta-L-altrosamine transaminase